MSNRFLKFLIALSVIDMILWILFSITILPLLPPRLSGGLSILGYGVIFLVVALVAIKVYEDNVPDDNEL